MIVLTRFHSGDRIAVNSELIERVEETPDTVITLTNGTKHVVQETIDEIVERVQAVKATTLALATRMVEDGATVRPAHLRVVHDAEHHAPGDHSVDPLAPGP
ncbi:MAG TPA: flagellar FlbD family protein [Acidimicrobiales bacterium]|nr:flagellar FlbD family protein [Acidimicrobiales bacterium]